MLFSFAAMAGGFALIFRGIEVMGCKTVSLSHSVTTCYSNELGALPGPVAGGGLVTLGVILFFVAMLRFATVR